MSVVFGCVVEGKGDVKAVPALIRKVMKNRHPKKTVEVAEPVLLQRGKLLQNRNLEKAVEAAAIRAGPDGVVLVLADADDDAVCTLGPVLDARAKRARPDRRVSVVLADVEYETWFMYAAPSLRGDFGFAEAMKRPAAPESIRDAKKWLSRHRQRGDPYEPPVHQALLTDAMNLREARRSHSFDKLVREVHFLATGKHEPKRSRHG